MTTIIDTRTGTIVGFMLLQGGGGGGGAGGGAAAMMLVQGDDGQTSELTGSNAEEAVERHLTQSLHARYKNKTSIWLSYTEHLQNKTGQEACVAEMMRTLNSCCDYRGGPMDGSGQDGGASWSDRSLTTVGWLTSRCASTVEEGKKKFLQLINMVRFLDCLWLLLFLVVSNIDMSTLTCTVLFFCLFFV